MCYITQPSVDVSGQGQSIAWNNPCESADEEATEGDVIAHNSPIDAESEFSWFQGAL